MSQLTAKDIAVVLIALGARRQVIANDLNECDAQIKAGELQYLELVTGLCVNSHVTDLNGKEGIIYKIEPGGGNPKSLPSWSKVYVKQFNKNGELSKNITTYFGTDKLKLKTK